MRADTITKEIRENFSDPDKLDMAEALTKKLVEVEQVESDKKAADSVFNERRKVLEGEIESLYRRYNKGYEMAQIGCEIRYNDPAPGQKSYYRMDTAAHVETAEMSWEEKQEELQFNLPEPKPEDLCACGHRREQHIEDDEAHNFACFAELGDSENCECPNFALKPEETKTDLSEEPTPPLRITEVPPDEPGPPQAAA